VAEPRRFRDRDLTWTPAHRLLAAHPDRLRTWRPQLQAIALSGPVRGAQITRIWARLGADHYEDGRGGDLGGMIG
jgi:hypothetical protein